MDYSKLSDNDLKALYNNDYSSMSNEGLKMLYGTPAAEPKKQGYQGIDYSDILNNKSLTKEQKAQAMHERTQAENKRIDNETNKKLAKMWAGGLLEIGSAAIPVGGGLKLATTLAKAGKPAAAKVAGAVLKNTPSLATSGGVAGLGTALRNDAKDINDYLKSIALGAGTGIAFGKGVEALGKGGQAALNSEFVKTNLPKVQELFNSVPAEYSERALRKELDGNSIFKGKFNSKDLNENYKEAGEKAIKGFQDAKLAANQELNNATRELNNLPAVDRNKLLNNIAEDIDQYAYGGDANAALDQKEADILNFMNEIASRNSNTALHVTKRNIQNLLRGKYGKETGEGINALKDVARNINEELYGISPAYEKANLLEQNLHDINDLLGGMNRKTIGSKLRNAESDATIRSGYNQAAEDLDSIVSTQNKFMDDVQNLRAREALEQWFPGQYGGFGTKEGFANLLRGLVISGGSAAATHNPLLALAFSPKISGKATIQGLGLLNQGLKGVSNFYDKAIEKYLNAERSLLTPKNKVLADENNK